MNSLSPWLWLVPVAALGLLVVLWHYYGFGREVQRARARESFRLQREHLEKLFFEKVSALGTPRGLRWLACHFSSEVEFAKERHTRRIVAIVGVTSHFEAIEGGDMEGLPAVPLPRQGCAVLHFSRGEWVPSGRVIFNLSPHQVLEQFAKQYERLPPAHL